MKKLILGMTLLSLTAFADSYVVEMKDTLNLKQKEQLQKLDKNIKIEKFSQYSSEYFDRLYSLHTSQSIKDKIAKLEFVKLIEEEFEADFFEIKPNANSKLLTSDILFPLQWGLLNQQQIVSKKKVSGAIGETIGVEGFDIDWQNGIKEIESGLKKNPVVAVVDMGIDLEHPELKDQIFKNTIECDENGKAKGGTKEDKDNNKYPGDCHGWNFATTDNLYWQYPFDDKNHGTHVAGIVAGKKNNQKGMSGVSDKIKILPVRVTGRVDETTARNSLLMKAPSRRIANGILYAVRMGVDVINLSLGWPKTMDTNFMRKVIGEATAKGIIVVAAAGNNNTNANIFPCAYFDVVCVGSIDIDGNMSQFSNYGGEVDILAPGDQIVSTIPTEFIPLKLNIQGYDILTGTSQAAPFVSAAAALLKGTYPDISKEEVMRRLYDSALEKKQKAKSLHGNLQLSKAFKLADAPSVKPIFKNLSDVVFDGKTGSFRFPLNFKNLGANTENVKVRILSTDKSLLFKSRQFLFKELKDYKPASIKVEGRLANPAVDLLTKIKVEVELEDGSVRSYHHELTLSKSIKGIPSQNIGFKFRDKRIPVAFVKEGKVVDNLRTVQEVYGKGNLPTYYVKFQERSAKKGLKLHFFNFDKGFFVQTKEDFEEKNAVKLLSVSKGDYNYDGKEDILIKTIVQTEDDGYVLYSYRNLDLSPLVGKYSDIKYRPEVVNVNTESFRFQRTKLDEKTYLATEVFVTKGALPKKDQVNDPWSLPDKSLIQRPYTMEVVEDGDGYAFEVRSFYNKNFLEKVREELKKYTHTTVSSDNTRVYLMDFKSQTEAEYYNDEVKLFFSYGLGFYRTNFILNISLDKRDIQIVQLDEKIENSDVIPFAELQRSKKSLLATAFIQYLTNNKLSLTTYSSAGSTNYVYDLGTKEDLIQSYLAMFEDEHNNYSFLETIDHIVLASISKTDKSIVQSKRKTKKFSFLPGVIMSEIFYPMSISKARTNVPAIYVDSTRISGNHIYVNTIEDNKIIAPAHLSLNIPKSCATKNPIMNSKGFYRYALICGSDKGYFLKYIDLTL